MEKELEINGQIYVLKEAVKPVQVTKEQRLVELFESCSPKIDREKYPESIFFFCGEKYYFEYDAENKYLFCSDDNVWSVFKTEYDMNDEQIQEFITAMVENHFKCKGVTTLPVSVVVLPLVENHFKCKGVTTKKWNRTRNNGWRTTSNARR